MSIKKHTSPNYNERRDGKNPSIIVIHYTGMKTAKAALERLCDPAAEVSAHYLIEENGTLHPLVPEDKRAWHAGVSEWEGETDINSMSIGIELVNLGHEHGYHPFPEAQMKTLAKLCKSIMTRHDIKTVLGHSDIAPTRKIDPGELFDWQYLTTAGIPNIHAI
ncbi:MAG: N-acetylmuramoyl-L-alanine amidase [Alphaproteobacteria bacterium]